MTEIITVSPEFMPTKASKGAAGYDVKANLEGKRKIIIHPNEKVLIDLGIKIHLGNSHVAIHLMPRSGLSTKKELILLNSVGLIDSDYQGSIKACFKNISDQPVEIEHLDRVAQLVFVPIIPDVAFKEVNHFSEDSERSIGGFGSTGVKFEGVNYEKTSN